MIQNNENVIQIEKYPSTKMGSWDYECIPEDLVICKTGNVEVETAFVHTISDKKYLRIYPVKPGKFTLCILDYDMGSFLIIEDSYAEDFVITDNLTIYSQGKRPIYEIEKYDKILFEQFTDDDSYLHIGWKLEDYPDVTYSIESNFETRTINVFVYDSKSDNENELRKIIEEHLNNRLPNEVMNDTKINIKFK
jgi:hypothetical protein